MHKVIFSHSKKSNMTCKASVTWSWTTLSKVIGGLYFFSAGKTRRPASCWMTCIQIIQLLKMTRSRYILLIKLPVLVSGASLELLVTLCPSEDYVNPDAHCLWWWGHEVERPLIGLDTEGEFGVRRLDRMEMVHIHFFNSL